MYFKYEAHEELIELMTYQILNMFSEYIEILSDTLDWQFAPYFTQYFTTQDHSSFPKFILFSGHAESLCPLLHAFKNSLLVDPDAASSIYIEYYETKDQ